MVKRIIRNDNTFEVVDDDLGKTFGVFDCLAGALRCVFR